MKIDYELVEHERWTEHAPARYGSPAGTDHWQRKVWQEVWADDPENGRYAGKVYKITEYRLNDTVYSRGSEPWTES